MKKRGRPKLSYKSEHLVKSGPMPGYRKGKKEEVKESFDPVEDIWLYHNEFGGKMFRDVGAIRREQLARNGWVDAPYMV